jgi:hypothetical protein
MWKLHLKPTLFFRKNGYSAWAPLEPLWVFLANVVEEFAYRLFSIA